MGLVKDSLRLVSEVVTLGGTGRLESAKLAYEDAYGRLQSLLSEANAFKTRINDAIEDIGKALTKAKPHLEKAQRLIKRPIEAQRDMDDPVAQETLIEVEKFNAEMNTALRVGVGSIAGGSLAVGAWSLVAAFGSASTGAAISGLSGVAATNATLAWFGGGALTAGGAGMAGGMTVLGGIVAVPLVYIAAKSTHKKAKELEELKLKVEENILAVQVELDKLPSIVRVAEARREVMARICNDVVTKISRLEKIIRPLGPLSAFKQRVAAFFGAQPYSRGQLDAISELTEVLASFLADFDEPATGYASSA